MINLHSDIWGPHAWFFIDSIVIALPDNISLNLQIQLKNFFFSFSSLLPCEKCRYHFSEYVNKTNMINADFSKKETVLKWVNTIHNNIRKRNGSLANRQTRSVFGSEPFTIEKTLKYYDKQYSSGSKNSYKDFFIIFIFICVVLYLLKHFYFTPLQQNI